MTIKIIQKLIDDVNTFYDTEYEYGIDYLDCLQSLCDELGISINA